MEAPSFTIRAAVAADCAVLHVLYRELDELHAGLQPGYFRVPAGRGRPEWQMVRQMTQPDEAVLVAEVDRASVAAEVGWPGRGERLVVGVVHLRVFAPPPEPAMVQLRRAHIDDLVVARFARGRGVGRGLMEAAVAWARGRDAAQVVLTVWAGNTEAEGFYRRLGYGVLSTVLGLDLR